MDEATHQQAMAEVDAARAALASGRTKKARDLFSNAADLEERCADEISLERPRTRGILRVSAVSMRREAGELERARTLAQRYLEEGLTPGFAREMHVLLAEVEDELAVLASVPRVDDRGGAELLRALELLEEQIAAGTVPRVAIALAA